MRNGIPKVRKWRVTLRDAQGRETARAVVDAPNKRFARWAARDVFGWHACYCAAGLTVALEREGAR